MENKKITLLSSFAEDKIIDKNGEVIKVQKGGPAFYISNIFRKEKVSFRIQSPPIIKVEILIKKEEELGRIFHRLEPAPINFSSINSPLIVISTILKDFNLNGIANFKGKIFMDVQGYVRDGINFGQKKYWKPTKEVAESIFCLKGTLKELTYVPSSFIKKQKQKVLIITKGKLGCEIFVHGKRHIVKPEKIIKCRHTIGAGDTLFAYLISKFLKTKDIIKSVKYAVDKTSKFLHRRFLHKRTI